MPVFTFIQHHSPGRKLNFLVCDSPTNLVVPLYAKTFKEHNVKKLMRMCAPTYDDNLFTGICEIYDLSIADGDVPSDDLIKKFIEIINKTNDLEAIGIHCTAGLGRAPLMVCIAIIIFGKVQCFVAIDLIRNKIKGSLNKKQIDFLIKFDRKKYTKYIKNNSVITDTCIVS
jgi:protein tyrosine phosphatase type 4A